MADDIYVVVKSMSAKGAKVPKEYVKTAPKLMCDAAVKTLNAGSGVTATMKGDKKKKGFALSGNLTSITIDAKKKTVFCEIKGYIALWPEDSMVAPGMVGKTGIKGSADQKDVEDCITICIESLAKDTVLKALKTLIKKHPR